MTSTCCGSGLWMILLDENIVPVPLTGVTVKASITNMLAVVQVEQSYVNAKDQPIEVAYKFPLDEGASVWKFSVEVDGRQIQDVVKETVEAEADYDEALRSGKSAFMMQEKLADVFMSRINALRQLFLHSLRADSYVNIVGFGSEYHLLFPEGSRKYDDEVLKITKEYTEGIDSFLGGTEILDPFEAILKLPTIKEYHRQVFDGAVSNRDEVISLVQKYSSFKKEDLTGTEPMLRQAPAVGTIPPVFSGKHLVVYALLEEGAPIPQKATVTMPDKPAHSIKVILNPVPIDGQLIHRLARKKLIQGLEDRPNETAEKGTIKLARTFGLASSFTAFVAVDPLKPNTTLALMRSSHLGSTLTGSKNKQRVQIFVVGIVGKTITLSVDSSKSIESMKFKIFAKTGIPPEAQLLCFAGKVLSHERTLNDYNIEAASTIHLLLRLLGGTACSSCGQDESGPFHKCKQAESLPAPSSNQSMSRSLSPPPRSQFLLINDELSHCLVCNKPIKNSESKVEHSKYCRRDSKRDLFCDYRYAGCTYATHKVRLLKEHHERCPFLGTDGHTPSAKEPKLPTPLWLFMQERIQQLRNGGMSLREAKSKSHTEFVQLPENELLKWIDRAEVEQFRFMDDVVRYREDHPEFKPTSLRLLTNKEEDLVNKRDGIPMKVPCSGYLLFLSEKKECIDIKNEMWRQLDRGTKEGYNKRVVELKKNYQENFISALGTMSEEKRQQVVYRDNRAERMKEFKKKYLEGFNKPIKNNADMTAEQMKTQELAANVSLELSGLQMIANAYGSDSEMNEPLEKGPLGEEKMMKVIGLQHANGSFKLDDVLSEILGDDIIEAGQIAKCPDELWPTLIAVSYLTLGLPLFRDSWAPVVEKANNWLGTLEFDEKLKRKAAKFINAKLKL